MVVATGFFDGVHLGHRYLIERLVAAARQRGTTAMVVTFWPHPRMVLQKDARGLRLLSSRWEKERMLLSLGVDKVETLRFTKDFSHLSTEEYLRDIIKGRFGADAIVLGYDNRMGFNAGSPEEIANIAGRVGLDVIQTPAMPGEAISSTRIRKALAEGDVERASAMLGYDYPLHGVVVAGNMLGRRLGYPTANLKLYEPVKQLPRRGVYLVQVETLGESFHGMCNIGYRPTVSQNESVTVETNIFDFDEEIYGLDLRIYFIAKIRDERKFSSIEELKAQLGRDKEQCIGLLEEHGRRKNYLQNPF